MNSNNEQKEIEAIYPLTYLQEGMLYHCIFNPDPELYFEQYTCRISGSLDINAFRAAWQEVINRHAILRTSFVWKNTDQMMQVVFKTAALPFNLLDWTALSKGEQNDNILILLEEHKKTGLKLNTAPLLNITVIKLSEDEYQFIWNHHHLIIDAWSQSILLKELFLLYEGFCKSEYIRLEMPRPFRDFVIWLRSNKDADNEQFWRKYLKGFTEPTLLPFESKNRAGTNKYEHEYSFLAQELTERLNGFARSLGVTISTILQCAWAILLSLYNEEDDVVFGMTTAGRPPEFEKIESIIGLFINTIPVRIRFNKDETVRELVQRVQSELLESRDYEYSSLVQIQGYSEVSGETPLFRSIFVFENIPLEKRFTEQLGSLKISDIRTSSKTNYPLVLVALPGDKISAGFAYDTNVYSAGTIKIILGHLTNILNSITRHPEKKLSSLSVISETEQQKTIALWNSRPQDGLKIRLLHEMFESQVSLTPDNPAVTFEGDTLSFTELKEDSNRLANYLIAKGVGAEDFVGLYLNRSIEMVTCILGILKAGAAYVPIDPNYPEERVNYILQDAHVKYLITKEELLRNKILPAESAVCLDSDKNEISACGTKDPVVKLSPDNAAYVIYTSGSTGKPKGVVVTHQGTCNLLENMKHDWAISSQSRIMQFASIGFDSSVPEIFLALTSGAELFIAPQDTVTSAEKITEFLAANRITFVTFPPSLLTLISKENISPQLTIISAGEACPWEAAQRWSECNKFFNAYGPTEVTVGCCWNEYKNAADKDSTATFPIGKPFQNVNIYILDRYLRPVPAGISGEIYVSGPGLARGYLNRPDLTSERFIPDPFSQEAGKRMYKTGDMAKYLSDGNIEYAGRNDSQVKIRGFRIEPLEIESVLMGRSEIKNAAVLVKERKSGEKYLAAYLITPNGINPGKTELRKYLSTKLPDYMIPAEYNFVETFPLTANGKIDRKALLKISAVNGFTEESRKPLTQLEELLGIIWEEVLEISDVDIHSNFFEIGGHSLKATRVISRIRKALGVNVTLSELFNNPTIYLLAKAIQRNSDSGLKNSKEELIEKSAKRNSDIKKFELSFAQQRLWFIEQMSPDDSIFNIPLALRFRGEINLEALRRSLTEVVRRQESLRTVFITENGQPFQIIKELENAALENIDLSFMEKTEAETELQRIASSELQKRFNISNEFPFRFFVVKISKNENVLLIIMHHIITDGWSMSIFIQELIHYYKAVTKIEISPLPELPIQYADFAEWQRRWFAGDVASEQLEYWENELAGIEPLIGLPTDFPRPQVQTFNGAAEKFIINKDLECRLRVFCLQESVTPYIALLSAFQILLARLSDTTDIVVGSPVANRTKHETERLIGFFVNTIVMRNTFHDNQCFQEVIKTNRAKVLLDFSHQDLPFEQLVQKLQPERSLSYAPVFQVAFVFQNFASSKYELPGLSASLVEIESSRTEYDITLTISEDFSGELTAYWEYNTDLFKKKTALRMIEQFSTLLENLLENPTKSIWDIPILTPEEYRRIVKGWNSNKHSIYYDCCINNVLEKVAGIYSEQIAVTYSDIVNSTVISSSITYRELNKRANQLANYLRRKGLKAENNVAVSIPRSINIIIAIVAVLKAGGTFIPLDPSYPKERLAFMLKDSGTEFLITTEELAEEQYSVFDKHVIAIDKEDSLIQRESPENPGNIVFSDNLAYIIYTSGSTGLPKGAMLSHKGMCNLSIFQHILGINRDSRILQFASSSFDAFIWEFLMAQSSGAKLDLISQALVSSPDDIAKVIHKTGTTVVTFPPSILARLPEKDENGEYLLSSLKTIIVAGEKIPVELANYWSERVKLYNGYGPTEITVCSSMHYCSGKYEHNVPIGLPVYNCELYVLDRHMHPVAVGIPGELYIGGVGLSRGYINKPDLTAEKFLPNPFSSARGARLYKSGDIVKFNENGILEFIGRIDSQVKIHGLRIELGEIESVMLEHPDILEAAVKVYGNDSTDSRLVGYLISKSGAVIQGNELRKFLRIKLPDYMVPSMFITLPEFPLTKSGKIDYKALPSPGIWRAEIEKKYVEPGNEIERKLSEIGMELLKVERIGIHDNFFELGGHSLLITRLISRIRDEFGAEIPLRTIFEFPTVSEIALIIQQQNGNKVNEKEIVGKTSRGEGSILDLVKEIEGLSENDAKRLLGEKE